MYIASQNILDNIQVKVTFKLLIIFIITCCVDEICLSDTTYNLSHSYKVDKGYFQIADIIILVTF